MTDTRPTTSHPDELLIIDDPYTERTRTKAELEAIKRWYTEVMLNSGMRATAVFTPKSLAEDPQYQEPK